MTPVQFAPPTSNIGRRVDALNTALKMVRGTGMEGTREFILRPDPGNDARALVDPRLLAHAVTASASSAMSINEHTPTDLTEKTESEYLYVPSHIESNHSMGYFIRSSVRRNETAAGNDFAIGRYMRSENNGEMLLVVTNIAYAGHQCLCLVWLAPPAGANRACLKIICDEALFHETWAAESVLYFEHSLRVTNAPCAECAALGTTIEPISMQARCTCTPTLIPPVDAHDFSHNMQNMSVHSASSVGTVTVVRAAMPGNPSVCYSKNCQMSIQIHLDYLMLDRLKLKALASNHDDDLNPPNGRLAGIPAPSLLQSNSQLNGTQAHVESNVRSTQTNMAPAASESNSRSLLMPVGISGPSHESALALSWELQQTDRQKQFQAHVWSPQQLQNGDLEQAHVQALQTAHLIPGLAPNGDVRNQEGAMTAIHGLTLPQDVPMFLAGVPPDFGISAASSAELVGVLGMPQLDHQFGTGHLILTAPQYQGTAGALAPAHALLPAMSVTGGIARSRVDRRRRTNSVRSGAEEHLSPDMRRKLSNRASAARSNLRRKARFDELKRNLEEIRQQAATLEQRRDELERVNSELKAEAEGTRADDWSPSDGIESMFLGFADL